MSSKASFKTRARIINQLGEQLIKNESIALLELIKNSYDADASECSVTMTNPDSEKDGSITIIDNGLGMDKKILETGWLEIGTSFKEDLNINGIKYRSPNFKRLPLGEKGIGRLGVHRLGKIIKVITKKENSDECVLEINWNDIEKSKYIEDLPIKITTRKPVTFKSSTGTKIVISQLRVPWDRKMARDCARTILSLNSPFKSLDTFRVTYTTGNNWLDGLLTYEDIKDYKLFSFDITMSGEEIDLFKYEFTPWETMTKLSYRELTQDDPEVSSATRMQYKDNGKYIDINLHKYDIGKVRFKGLIFDRDPRVLDMGVNDKSGLKKFLSNNGGVRVFRDNMRIMDYGEQGDDWLDLDGRRVNIPAKRVSKNIIIGAVFLDREKSSGLVEKANREGFVENAAYWELFQAVRFALDKVETFRKIDKDIMRKHYGADNIPEPVISNMADLKTIVEDNVKDVGTKNKIFIYLDRIEKEYESVTNSLIKSAGAGLNLIIIIHQIQKIIKDIIAMLSSNTTSNLIETRVKELSDLIEGYSLLVKNSDKKSRNMKKLLTQGIFNIKFRLKKHKIVLEQHDDFKSENANGMCSVDHTMNALINIFDNSIWWLEYSKTKNAGIYVCLSDKYQGYISILIADNGPGFTLPREEMIKPFVSNKPGGMGIGLALTSEIMKSLGGKLILNVNEYFELPEKYRKGAAVALAFKVGVN